MQSTQWFGAVVGGCFCFIEKKTTEICLHVRKIMLIVHTSLRSSPIHGIGVFAEEPIKKGQVVWEFDPDVDLIIPTDELEKLAPTLQSYLKTYGYVEIKDGKRVMILCSDNAKHVNHSDNPNLVDTFGGTQGIAVKDIEVGEELTSNYYFFDLEATIKLNQDTT